MSNFRPHMEIAMGALGWPPEVFWSSTMHEFVAAVDGKVRVNTPEPDGMSQDEYEQMKRRFPDG